ncbi:MAG: hypothetical protein K6E62_02820, partial [Lachnospiraceae bacterium]|nr:hypothetical protein [Lachnospiraceae bacterium]
MTDKEQIASLTHRVYELEREVRALKEVVLGAPQSADSTMPSKNQAGPGVQPAVTTQTANIQSAVNNQTVVPAQTAVSPQATANTQAVSNIQPAVNAQAANIQSAVNNQTIVPAHPAANTLSADNSVPVKTGSGDIESKIGKTVMGVLASVLVFISLVIFARMIYKLIPDEVKVLLMFVISLSIAALGLIKMSADSKYNVLFTSLAGCGVGAFYISAMLTYFVFEMISQPVLMLIIVLWLAATVFLAARKSEIFVYICNAGLIIASFMAAIEWTSSPIASILYIVVLAALYVVKHNKNLKDYYYFLQVPLICTILAAIHSEESVGQAVAIVFLVAVYLLLWFVNLVYNVKAADWGLPEVLRVIYTIETIASTFLLVQAFAEASDNAGSSLWNTDGPGILFIGFMCFGCILYFFRHYAYNRWLFYIWYTISAVLIPIICFELKIQEYTGLIPVFAIMLCLGILIDDKIIRFSGYIWAAIFVFNIPGTDTTMIRYMTAAIITCAVLGLLALVRTYHWTDKYLLTFLAMIYTWGFLYTLDELLYATSRDNLESWYLAFVIPAALSVFMNTKFYLASDESRIARTIGYVTNGLCLTIGLFMVAFAWESNTAATVALILAVLALSGVNVKNVFTMFSNHWLPGVYTGIKFSLVIIVLLAKFSAVSYVVSIVLILAALIFITAGFRFEQKSLRIYGLCVTLLCIFK